MTNTSMRSCTTLETRLGTVVHVDVAGMNVPLVGKAEHIVTFIGEAYETSARVI